MSQIDNAKVQDAVEHLKKTLSRREFAKVADIMVVSAGIRSNNPIRSKSAEQYRKSLYGDRAHWQREFADTPENGT